MSATRSPNGTYWQIGNRFFVPDVVNGEHTVSGADGTNQYVQDAPTRYNPSPTRADGGYYVAFGDGAKGPSHQNTDPNGFWGQTDADTFGGTRGTYDGELPGLEWGTPTGTGTWYKTRPTEQIHVNPELSADTGWESLMNTAAQAAVMGGAGAVGGAALGLFGGAAGGATGAGSGAGAGLAEEAAALGIGGEFGAGTAGALGSGADLGYDFPGLEGYNADIPGSGFDPTNLPTGGGSSVGDSGMGPGFDEYGNPIDGDTGPLGDPNGGGEYPPGGGSNPDGSYPGDLPGTNPGTDLPGLPPGSSTAPGLLNRLMNGDLTAADMASLASMFGNALPGLLSAYGNSQTQGAYEDLTREGWDREDARYQDVVGREEARFGTLLGREDAAIQRAMDAKNLGWRATKPYRNRLNQSMQPGFDPMTIGGYAGAVDTASQSLLARLSATGGNPFGNPGGMIEANKQIIAGTALPAIQNYQRMNFDASGLAAQGQASAYVPGINSSLPGSVTQGASMGSSGAMQPAMAGVGAGGNVWGNIGSGLSAAFNPPPPPSNNNWLYDLLKRNGIS